MVTGLGAWVDRVTAWDFERIVPAHFEAPIAAGPKDFAAAFDFLKTGQPTQPTPF